MEMKGALTMNPQSAERMAHSGDDLRYYPRCPLSERHGRKTVPLSKCFDCEFVTGHAQDGYIGIRCGFPNRERKNK